MFRLCQDIAKLEILKKSSKSNYHQTEWNEKITVQKHNKKVYVTHQIQLREGMDRQT